MLLAQNTKSNVSLSVLLISRSKLNPVPRTDELPANVTSFYSPDITPCTNQFASHSDYVDKMLRPACEPAIASQPPLIQQLVGSVLHGQ